MPHRAAGPPGARAGLGQALAVMDPDAARLAARAATLLARVHRPGVHDVVAVGLLDDGTTVEGVHVEASQGRASVCAEGCLVGAAALAARPLVLVVALLRRADGHDHLIEPCGVCAELLADHHPDAVVWTGTGGTAAPVRAGDLLPWRVTRTSRLPRPVVPEEDRTP